jgi:hypothetical protein
VQPEDSLPPLELIGRFRAAFWDSVRPSLRRFTLVGLLTALLAAALTARLGTPLTRLTALGIVILTATFLTAWHWRKVRQLRDARRVLRQVVLPCDPEAGRRALRAIRLCERALNDTSSGSPVLAMRFVERALSAVPIEKIQSKGRRTAILFETLVLLGVLASGVMVVRNGHRILEGCNVALSSHGRAPFHMDWLDVSGVSALPPAYLRISEHALLFGARVSEPKGTLLWIRGVPIHPAVELMLTNGSRSVAFEGNSDGELIVRWTVEQSERLYVAARLGQVLIEQGDELMVDAEIDAPPTVELENTPRTIQLRQRSRAEVFYRAKDDHGLRQVDLVLKVADREQRRELMHLDGEKLEQQGSYAISADDPLLKNTHLPVLLRIEARDDNSLVQNNWGHSDWVKLEPESPGETEASRLLALDSIRAALLDWLALRVTVDTTAAVPAQDVLAHRAFEQLRLSESGPWEWPKAMALLLTAQREQLEKATRNAATLTEALEQATLSVDAAQHMLAQRDATSVARSLADIADDIARSAHQGGNSEQRAAAIRRVDDAAPVLSSGGRQLANLGSLGWDLAGIIRATLNRLERARKVEDFTHIELAAEYLAARLRRPTPSAAQSSGVESGAGVRDASRVSRSAAAGADVRIERLLMELQQLRAEHQSAVELLERTLKTAEADAKIDDPRPAAKQRAERIRRLAERLPSLGAEPESARSSQAVAREQAFGMAEAVERLAYDEALTRGRAVRDAINEAMIRASREAEPGLDKNALQSLRNELEGESQVIEQALKRAKQRATAAVGGQLREQGGNERQLANRARALAERRKVGNVSLPESMRNDLDKASGLMKQASDSLDRNDGELAFDHETRAQALLDQFDSHSNRASSGEANGEVTHSSPALDKGIVKPTGDPQAAAAFRRRVQRGLSQEVPGELGATIRRYAEGLLR